MKSFETRPLADENHADQVSNEIETESPEVEREHEVSAEQGELVVVRGTTEDIEAPGEEVDGQILPPPQRRRFRLRPPTGEQLLRWAPFWGVILLGAILRFWGLGDKPLHHDESLHAYYSWQLLLNLEHWSWCISPPPSDPSYACYTYNPLLHGPFQFHFIALVYRISQLVGAPDNGISTTTVRIPAALLGTLIVALPYFLRDYLGKWGALLASFLLAVSPSMVYFSRFAREDIYFACFTLVWIVGVARYVRDRKMRWLVIAAAGFALAYATKEAIFLEMLIFGAFLGALIVWELGLKLPLRARLSNGSSPGALLPQTFAPLFVVVYFAIAGIAGKLLLNWIDALAKVIVTPGGAPTAQADQFVNNLKQNTVATIPWLGIALGIFVLILLFREMSGKLPPQERHGLAKFVDPQKQPLLDAIVTMPWTHWFFALLCGWAIFLVLFTILFTNPAGGIGDGIWQGIYYWIQQQQVARGNEPWYYYLMVIPLYEQIGVVFGLIGILRCIAQPTRFRLFLVYWLVGNLFLYSWAAEKMPWLTIHMTMPLMLLAAIGLEPVVVTCVNFVRQFLSSKAVDAPVAEASVNGNVPPVVSKPPSRRKVGLFSGSAALLGLVAAVLLLLPTLHNTYELSYIHPADGPHEMLVYVQTTTDVNIVMNKINQLDQKFYGGQHQIPIAITADATWPFAWYVRDYPNICFDYPTGCPTWPKNLPVIIGAGDAIYSMETQYTAVGGGRTNSLGGSPYVFHQYHMRTWWDEGYKQPICETDPTVTCTGQALYGYLGPLLWLSYGNNPPPGAKFNFSLAAQRIWNWWWNRTAFGDTHGAFDMVLLVRSDLSKTVAP